MLYHPLAARGAHLGKGEFLLAREPVGRISVSVIRLKPPLSWRITHPAQSALPLNCSGSERDLRLGIGTIGSLAGYHGSDGTGKPAVVHQAATESCPGGFFASLAALTVRRMG
jgi:hypothetical protein